MVLELRLAGARRVRLPATPDVLIIYMDMKKQIYSQKTSVRDPLEVFGELVINVSKT